MSDSSTTQMASAAETKQASPRDLSNLDFNSSDMSDSPTTTTASTAETKQASPRDLSNFDFPALDRSKNQFRLLVLAPGDFDDEITATIVTRCLPSLPAGYNHKPHLIELTAIHDNLSIASSTGTEIQIEELLRWERLYGELMELYMMTLRKSHAPDASGRYNISVPKESDVGRLLEMRHLFIEEVRQYQSKSCNLSEVVDAMQTLISRLEAGFAFGPAFQPAFHDYIAVSYCCGDQRILKDITLNNARVQIPASAERALRGIRSKYRASNFWIDAICINPSDSKERTHQVLLMSKIYSSAYSTIVRLESAGDVADRLLSACFVDYKTQRNDYPEVMWNAKSFIDSNSAVPETLRNTTQNLLRSLLVYLNQPWFGRLWVYQEVLLSQYVIVSVGRNLTSWAMIRIAIEYFECLSPAPELWDGVNVSGLRVSTPWRARRNGHENGSSTQPRNPEFYLGYTPPSLTSLLLETIPLECLDPRDKVYALLGLTSWSVKRKTLPSELEPDYTLPVSECMRNATLAAIREEMSLECLTLPTWTRQDQSWPSWVVPWHKLEVDRNRRSHLNIPNDIARYSWIPDCSRGQKVNLDNLRQPDRPDSLFLEGNIWSEVVGVSDVINPQDLMGLSFEMKLREVIRSVENLFAGRYSRGQLCTFLMMMLWWKAVDLSEKSRRMSVGDAVSGSALQSSGEHVEDRNYSDERTRRDDSESGPEEPARLKRLVERLLAEAHAPRDHEKSSAAPWRGWSAEYAEGLDCFISTSRFYLGKLRQTGSSVHIFGCGPQDMEAEDAVVVLRGSRAPVILRQEQTWFLWVGPAFPLALLDEESCLGSPSCGDHSVVFEIR
jgi:hypothetical protein